MPIQYKGHEKQIETLMRNLKLTQLTLDAEGEKCEGVGGGDYEVSFFVHDNPVLTYYNLPSGKITFSAQRDRCELTLSPNVVLYDSSSDKGVLNNLVSSNVTSTNYKPWMLSWSVGIKDIVRILIKKNEEMLEHLEIDVTQGRSRGKKKGAVEYDLIDDETQTETAKFVLKSPIEKILGVQTPANLSDIEVEINSDPSGSLDVNVKDSGIQVRIRVSDPKEIRDHLKTRIEGRRRDILNLVSQLKIKDKNSAAVAVESIINSMIGQMTEDMEKLFPTTPPQPSKQWMR